MGKEDCLGGPGEDFKDVDLAEEAATGIGLLAAEREG